MAKNQKIEVQGIDIVLYEDKKEDFISLTDIARFKNPTEPKDVVKNWMHSRATIEFLGLWEQLNNPDFKGVDFDPPWSNWSYGVIWRVSTLCLYNKV